MNPFFRSTLAKVLSWDTQDNNTKIDAWYTRTYWNLRSTAGEKITRRDYREKKFPRNECTAVRNIIFSHLTQGAWERGSGRPATRKTNFQGPHSPLASRQTWFITRWSISNGRWRRLPEKGPKIACRDERKVPVKSFDPVHLSQHLFCLYSLLRIGHSSAIERR